MENWRIRELENSFFDVTNRLINQLQLIFFLLCNSSFLTVGTVKKSLLFSLKSKKEYALHHLIGPQRIATLVNGQNLLLIPINEFWKHIFSEIVWRRCEIVCASINVEFLVEFNMIDVYLFCIDYMLLLLSTNISYRLHV